MNNVRFLTLYSCSTASDSFKGKFLESHEEATQHAKGQGEWGSNGYVSSHDAIEITNGPQKGFYLIGKPVEIYDKDLVVKELLHTLSPLELDALKEHFAKNKA